MPIRKYHHEYAMFNLKNAERATDLSYVLLPCLNSNSGGNRRRRNHEFLMFLVCCFTSTHPSPPHTPAVTRCWYLRTSLSLICSAWSVCTSAAEIQLPLHICGFHIHKLNQLKFECIFKDAPVAHTYIPPSLSRPKHHRVTTTYIRCALSEDHKRFRVDVEYLEGILYYWNANAMPSFRRDLEHSWVSLPYGGLAASERTLLGPREA